MVEDMHSRRDLTRPPIVLVADFEATTRNMLGHGLRQAGLDVVAVTAPAVALATITGRSFDLAIVDIQDGTTLVERIRRSAPSVRLVAITSRPSTAFTAQAMRLGALDVYVKPVHASWIVKWIDQTHVLKQRAQHAPPRLLRLDEHEREYLERVLVECGGNLSECARVLGLHRRSVQRKLS